MKDSKENSLDIKLSVIIPMYNSFEILRKKLYKLEKIQKFQIEIIIVDDYSSDNSYELACAYAKESPVQLVVIQNENNYGPGISRNNGIKHATGDYITFLDSDDYFSDEFESQIANLMKQDIDCIIFNYRMVSQSGKKIGSGKAIEIDLKEGFIPIKDAFVYTFGSTMGKIYKRSIIEKNDVRFAELYRSEDLPFTKKAIAVSKQIFYLPRELYMYTQSETSLMHRAELNDESNCQKAFVFLKEGVKYYGFEEELKAIEVREVINNGLMILFENGATKEVIKKYLIDNYSLNLLKNKYFCRYSKHVKVITILSCLRAFLLLKLIYAVRTFIKNRRKKC